MRSAPLRLTAIVLASVLAVSACGGDDDNGPSAPEVSGDFGEKPKVEIPEGYSVDSSETEVVDEGDGATVSEGDEVLVQVAAYNGSTGQPIADMFSGQNAGAQTMKVSEKTDLLPGLTNGITGESVGSRLLLSISPEDGFGNQGNPRLQIGPDDTVVALVDLLPIKDPPKPNGSVDDVRVTAAPDAKPAVDFKKPLYVGKTESQVVSPGDGAVVKKGDVVTVDYVGFNARTGKEFDSSYGAKQQSPAQFPLRDDQVIPGFIDGLVGKKLGSRVLLAIPRDQGYGPNGNQQAGIKGTDTLLFVVDLKTPPPKPDATGTIDDVTVTGKDGQKPKVQFATPFFVDQTQSRVLSRGDGKPVKAGDKVQVNYVGINGRTGKEFDGNFGSEPTSFTLNEQSVIPGFVKGLTGTPRGSRVLITIPRDDGYGENGNPQAQIEGGDTLVFVIDIAKSNG